MSIADIERVTADNLRKTAQFRRELARIDRRAGQGHVYGMAEKRHYPVWIGILSVAVILLVVGSFIAIAATGERAAIFALAIGLTAWAAVGRAIEVYDRHHA